MKLICSPNGLLDPIRPDAGFVQMQEAGFEPSLLDMGMYCTPWNLERYGTEIYPKSSFGSLENTIWKVVKAPMLAMDTKRADMNDVLREMTAEGLRYSAAHGCEYYIVPPLFAGIERKNIWPVNKQYYLELAQLLDTLSTDSYSMRILIKNLSRDMHGHAVRGICSDAHIARQWIEELNEAAGSDMFGICVDIGTLNLCGQDMYEYVHTLGSHVKAVIFRENDGKNDVSMLPFTSVAYRQSQMDWNGIIRGLREIEFDGYLILEFSDTAAAFSPLLRQPLLQMAKSVGDFLKWQIELESILKKQKKIVLFGAGNMCRNYMKNYGKKYPPLFTCDNNPALWGTKICGLEVKSPEALKQLPEDCTILLCNVYYREIEQQLRDMGISNKVEYFNDEYIIQSEFFN